MLGYARLRSSNSLHSIAYTLAGTSRFNGHRFLRGHAQSPTPPKTMNPQYTFTATFPPAFSRIPGVDSCHVPAPSVKKYAQGHIFHNSGAQKCQDRPLTTRVTGSIHSCTNPYPYTCSRLCAFRLPPYTAYGYTHIRGPFRLPTHAHSFPHPTHNLDPIPPRAFPSPHGLTPPRTPSPSEMPEALHGAPREPSQRT